METDGKELTIVGPAIAMVTQAVNFYVSLSCQCNPFSNLDEAVTFVQVAMGWAASSDVDGVL